MPNCLCGGKAELHKIRSANNSDNFMFYVQCNDCKLKTADYFTKDIVQSSLDAVTHWIKLTSREE